MCCVCASVQHPSSGEKPSRLAELRWMEILGKTESHQAINSFVPGLNAWTFAPLNDRLPDPDASRGRLQGCYYDPGSPWKDKKARQRVVATQPARGKGKGDV